MKASRERAIGPKFGGGWTARPNNVRFTTESGHAERVGMSALCQKQTLPPHWIASSARANKAAAQVCGRRPLYLSGFLDPDYSD
jgi:hypothetical protein